MSKTQQYPFEIEYIKRALGQPNALVDDNTLFVDLLPSKNIDAKVKSRLKKLEKDYRVHILFGHKIADIAEEMYNYRPF